MFARLCPATNAGRAPPSASQRRQSAIETVRMAGWVVGSVQALFRTILDQRPKVVTERLGGLGEGIAHQRLLGAQLGQHAEGLRTLAREDECEGCRH